MRFGHGDDGYRYGHSLRADFSTNVWPGGPAPALVEHLRGELARIGRYPEAAAESLTERLAERHGVSPDEVLVTSGGVAAIYLIAQLWRGQRAGLVGPTFAEYEDAGRIHGQEPVWLAPEALASDPRVGTCGLLWLCNPNNPTGEVRTREEVLALVDRWPQTMFAVDLAYAEFCDIPALQAGDAARRDNLLLVHSLTKTHALPGLRLGAVLGGAVAIARLAAASPPWAVNALALAAGEFCLRREWRPALPRERLLAESRRLQAAVTALSGYTARPSATTFFLIETARGRSAELKRHLVQRHGLLVRDAANFRGLGDRCIRVAAQRPEQNDELVEALRAWMPCS